MRCAWIGMLGLLLAAHAAAQAAAVGPSRFDFDASETGKAPAAFSTELTGGGGPATWEVRADPTAPSGKNVLVQTSTDKTDYRFPLCVYDGLLTHNVVMSVRFKAVSGTIDQAAGLLVRFKDKNNYYVVRANALEDNVRLYKVVDGRRTQFAGSDVKVRPDTWHTLKLSLKTHRFEVWLDGARLFGADDMTLQEAGEVGLWTKADSVTAFDDFTIEESDAGH
jgi:Galactocerebrosidase, C-terminal lectin domain